MTDILIFQPGKNNTHANLCWQLCPTYYYVNPGAYEQNQNKVNATQSIISVNAHDICSIIKIELACEQRNIINIILLNYYVERIDPMIALSSMLQKSQLGKIRLNCNIIVCGNELVHLQCLQQTYCVTSGPIGCSLWCKFTWCPNSITWLTIFIKALRKTHHLPSSFWTRWWHTAWKWWVVNTNNKSNLSQTWKHTNHTWNGHGHFKT